MTLIRDTEVYKDFLRNCDNVDRRRISRRDFNDFVGSMAVVVALMAAEVEYLQKREGLS